MSGILASSWQTINHLNRLIVERTGFMLTGKAVANGPVGQVLAGPLFLKVKTKFHFTESK